MKFWTAAKCNKNAHKPIHTKQLLDCTIQCYTSQLVVNVCPIVNMFCTNDSGEHLKMEVLCPTTQTHTTLMRHFLHHHHLILISASNGHAWHSNIVLRCYSYAHATHVPCYLIPVAIVMYKIKTYSLLATYIWTKHIMQSYFFCSLVLYYFLKMMRVLT